MCLSTCLSRPLASVNKIKSSTPRAKAGMRTRRRVEVGVPQTTHTRWFCFSHSSLVDAVTQRNVPERCRGDASRLTDFEHLVLPALVSHPAPQCRDVSSLAGVC